MPIADDRFSAEELHERAQVRRAIGSAIRRRREAARLTQVDVATLSNISARELRRIEGGKGGMQLDRLWPIAHALNCTPAEIVYEAQEIVANETGKR